MTILFQGRARTSNLFRAVHSRPLMATQMMEILERAKAEAWSDEEVVRRVLEGETALYEILMRRYNQRLYRVARAILRDDAEAEDVMQDAYVRAYQHLDQFAGRAPFSTWLTRIAVHEALCRIRPAIVNSHSTKLRTEEISPMSLTDISLNPEQSVSNAETGRLWKKPY